MAKYLPELMQYREDLLRLDVSVQDRELLWIFARKGDATSGVDGLGQDGVGCDVEIVSSQATSDDQASQATSKADDSTAGSGNEDQCSDACPTVATSDSATWPIK